MSLSPLISVIINCYNSEQYILRSVKSVLNQTYQNIEVIVYDNNSTDKTVDILKKNLNDTRLKIIENSQHVELFKARNQALNHCRGKLIAFLDSDDFYKKNKIQISYNSFSEDSELSMIYTNAFIYNENNKKYYNYPIKNENLADIKSHFIKNYKVMWSSVVFKKEIFKDNNFLFDEKFKIIGDYDFVYRVAIKKKIVFINKRLSYRSINDQNLSGKSEKLIILDLKLFYLKNILKDRNIKKKDKMFYLGKLSFRKFLYLLKEKKEINSKILKKFIFFDFRIFIIFILSLISKQLTYFLLKNR